MFSRFVRLARRQRQRTERVLACGADIIRIECALCGRTHEKTQGCRVSLMCVRCRGAIASEKRAMFLRARAVVLADATQRGLLDPRRPRGRWSEKMLTLTPPHLESDTIASRIKRTLDAWPRFRRRLVRHLKELDAARSSHFYRSFEWTPGNDRRGHPHFHVWLFTPYLDRELPLAWWRASLIEAGFPPEEASSPIIDIRALEDSPQSAQELIKYLTKDIDENGDKLPPELYAEVYKALDRHRSTQPSRGFMQLAKRTKTCVCGATEWSRIRVLHERQPDQEDSE